MKKDTEQLTLSKLLFKTTILSLLMVSAMLIVTLIIASILSWFKFQKLANEMGSSSTELIEIAKEGYYCEPSLADGRKNFLILGLDTLDNRGDVPSLTDTMMLLSINTKTGIINTLSLPRDLWSQDYQTKINALYHYGQDKYPDNPEKFPTDVIQDISGIPIQHTIVITLDQLEEIIDIVGGIDIDVEQGFTDDQFPRNDVDVTKEWDPKKLYETITFEEGSQHMDGENALKFIRSRHSIDDQGTDDARAQRQQLVIQSLAASLMDYKYLTRNTDIVVDLYKYYQDNFNDQLSMVELISTLKILYPQKDNISFNRTSLSIGDEYTDGVIINPPSSAKYQNQWIYIPTDDELLKEEIQNKLLGLDK